MALVRESAPRSAGEMQGRLAGLTSTFNFCLTLSDPHSKREGARGVQFQFAPMYCYGPLFLSRAKEGARFARAGKRGP